MSVNPILNYTLHGLPTRVFPFPPNWATPVTETFEWRTDVIKAFDGTEQRRQLRQKPRRGFEYGMLLSGQMAAMLEAYLWSWQHKNFALPVWTDICHLTAPLVAGSTSMSVDNAATLGFSVGGYAIVYVNPRLFEVVNVSAVTSNTISFGSGNLYDWSAGAKVMPLVIGRLGTSVQTTRVTSAVTKVANVMFQTSPHLTYDNLPNVAAVTLYDGYEVVTTKPNWRDTINNDFTREFDTLDGGVGPIGYYDRESVSRIVRPFSWLLKSRTEIAEFRGFIKRMAGQQKMCWMPSWHDDFTLAAGNAGMQHSLTVKGIWFNDMVGVDPDRSRLMVTLPNGTNVFRRIIQMAPNYLTDMTQLELDSPLGSTVSVGDNLRIRLLLRCRFATDKIVIPWQTDRLATPQTTFTTVKI